MELLIRLLDFLMPYGTQSYIIMFLVLLACGLGLPLPEDIVLVTAGILASHDITEFWITNIVCMVGVLGGDGFMFSAGRYFGPRNRETWLFKRVMSEKMDKRVEQVFARWGNKVIFMARFMPGLRAPIFMTAGTYQVAPSKFLLLDGFAALISVPGWIWIGELFGDNLELLHEKMKQFQALTIGSLVVAIVVGVVVIKIKRRNESAAQSSTT